MLTFFLVFLSFGFAESPGTSTCTDYILLPRPCSSGGRTLIVCALLFFLGRLDASGE